MAGPASEVFRDLLPKDVVCEQIGLQDLEGDGQHLVPPEHEVVQRAVRKRRREFEAGRLLARRAMARLGVEPVALMPGPGRAPQWPEPIVGSITHTRRLCAVAAGLRSSHRAIGIDLEPDEPIKPGLFRMICTPPELDALAELPEAERGRACRIVFCAKEAAYKAQFSITQQFLPFSAMSVHLADARFEATLNVAVAEHFAAGHVFAGRYRKTGELIATAVVVSKPADE